LQHRAGSDLQPQTKQSRTATFNQSRSEFRLKNSSKKSALSSSEILKANVISYREFSITDKKNDTYNGESIPKFLLRNVVKRRWSLKGGAEEPFVSAKTEIFNSSATAGKKWTQGLYKEVFLVASLYIKFWRAN